MPRDLVNITATIAGSESIFLGKNMTTPPVSNVQTIFSDLERVKTKFVGLGECSLVVEMECFVLFSDNV